MRDTLHRLAHLLTGHGQHRAADYIPIVEAERDHYRNLAELRETALGHADDLITHLCIRHDKDQQQIALLANQRDMFAENDNLRAISSPAPADHAPAIPVRAYDPEATEDLQVSTLWDGINSLTVLNKHAQAAA
jgi:hypothetical protein